MLIKNLGREYMVWDKSATVRFRKPARTTLYGRFVLAPEDIETIRRWIDEGAKASGDETPIVEDANDFLTPDDRELRVGRTLAVTPPRQTPETAPSPAVGITSQP